MKSVASVMLLALPMVSTLDARTAFISKVQLLQTKAQPETTCLNLYRLADRGDASLRAMQSCLGGRKNQVRCRETHHIEKAKSTCSMDRGYSEKPEVRSFERFSEHGSDRPSSAVLSRLVAFLRAAIVHAAVLISFFFWGPARAHGTSVSWNTESPGANIVYMHQWSPDTSGTGGSYYLSQSATAGGTSSVDTEASLQGEQEGDSKTKQERRLAAIRHEISSMWDERRKKLAGMHFF